MKLSNRLTTLFAIPALCLGLAACDDGAEDFGEGVDETVEEVEDAAEDAVDETEDAVDDAADELDND